jgi:hypothetical protein
MAEAAPNNSFSAITFGSSGFTQSEPSKRWAVCLLNNNDDDDNNNNNNNNDTTTTTWQQRQQRYDMTTTWQRQQRYDLTTTWQQRHDDNNDNDDNSNSDTTTTATRRQRQRQQTISSPYPWVPQQISPRLQDNQQLFVRQQPVLVSYRLLVFVKPGEENSDLEMWSTNTWYKAWNLQYPAIIHWDSSKILSFTDFLSKKENQ